MFRKISFGLLVIVAVFSVGWAVTKGLANVGTRNPTLTVPKTSLQWKNPYETFNGKPETDAEASLVSGLTPVELKAIKNAKKKKDDELLALQKVSHPIRAVNGKDAISASCLILSSNDWCTSSDVSVCQFQSTYLVTECIADCYQNATKGSALLYLSLDGRSWGKPVCSVGQFPQITGQTIATNLSLPCKARYAKWVVETIASGSPGFNITTLFNTQLKGIKTRS